MENSLISKVNTFGDVRRLIIETIMGVRDGGLNPGQGAVMAANFKELNNNIQCEINATKVSLLTEGKAHKFGNVVRMGTRLIADNTQENV
jgi:hypothetical protein